MAQSCENIFWIAAINDTLRTSNEPAIAASIVNLSTKQLHDYYERHN